MKASLASYSNHIQNDWLSTIFLHLSFKNVKICSSKMILGQKKKKKKRLLYLNKEKKSIRIY